MSIVRENVEYCARMNARTMEKQRKTFGGVGAEAGGERKREN